MPTYDYRCPNGHQFEVFQRISAAPGAECPDCGEDSERMISGGAGLIFKGEGFYITDYRSEDYKKKASSRRLPQRVVERPVSQIRIREWRRNPPQISIRRPRRRDLSLKLKALDQDHLAPNPIAEQCSMNP